MSRRKATATAPRIPRRVIQTFSTPVVPECLESGVRSWRERNPEWSYQYSIDAEQREFIRANFDAGVVAAYDALVPGAYRADLWRYCNLYVHGGVYTDIKSQCDAALNQVLDDSLSFAIALERDFVPRPALFNAWIASVPKHPWMHAAIDECVRAVRRRHYGANALDVTGPCALGRAVYRRMKWSADFALEPGVRDCGGRYGRVKILRHVDGDRIIDDAGRTVVYTRITPDPTGLVRDREFFRTLTGMPHYLELWVERRIYAAG